MPGLVECKLKIIAQSLILLYSALPAVLFLNMSWLWPSGDKERIEKIAAADFLVKILLFVMYSSNETSG